jgi:hypothetical protein
MDMVPGKGILKNSWVFFAEEIEGPAPGVIYKNAQRVAVGQGLFIVLCSWRLHIQRNNRMNTGYRQLYSL